MPPIRVATAPPRATDVANGAIAVFGSSEPQPGEALYETAREVGRLLALDGHSVLTGGYGGMMEGASRGATEAGGEAIGVICDIFPDRKPNPYVSRVVRSADLHERTRLLIEGATGFVVLAGKAGTLAELALLWALQRAGCLGRRPMVTLGDLWPAVVEQLAEAGLLESAQLARMRFTRSPAESVAALRRAFREEGSE